MTELSGKWIIPGQIVLFTLLFLLFPWNGDRNTVPLVLGPILFFGIASLCVKGRRKTVLTVATALAVAASRWIPFAPLLLFPGVEALYPDGIFRRINRYFLWVLLLIFVGGAVVLGLWSRAWDGNSSRGAADYAVWSILLSLLFLAVCDGVHALVWRVRWRELLPGIRKRGRMILLIAGGVAAAGVFGFGAFLFTGRMRARGFPDSFEIIFPEWKIETADGRTVPDGEYRLRPEAQKKISIYFFCPVSPDSVAVRDGAIREIRFRNWRRKCYRYDSSAGCAVPEERICDAVYHPESRTSGSYELLFDGKTVFRGDSFSGYPFPVSTAYQVRGESPKGWGAFGFRPDGKCRSDLPGAPGPVVWDFSRNLIEFIHPDGSSRVRDLLHGTLEVRDSSGNRRKYRYPLKTGKYDFSAEPLPETPSGTVGRDAGYSK